MCLDLVSEQRSTLSQIFLSLTCSAPLVWHCVYIVWMNALIREMLLIPLKIEFVSRARVCVCVCAHARMVWKLLTNGWLTDAGQHAQVHLWWKQFTLICEAGKRKNATIFISQWYEKLVLVAHTRSCILVCFIGNAAFFSLFWWARHVTTFPFKFYRP